jgi:hypothetical protein
MSVVVFLGPSMPHSEARTILPNASFRPPAAQGDLLSCFWQDRPRVVALIDGTFHQNLSVWHTELCFLLSRGVAVYGSSSMGALRAVETERFGTIGVGRIFEWYRDGVIIADDEVALVHGPEEMAFCPLSVPLVNIRASVERAFGLGWIDADIRDRVVEIARAIYYPQRQIDLILQRCEEVLFETSAHSGVLRALTEGYVDIKREDARELLVTIRKHIAEGRDQSSTLSFQFNSSGGFDGLCNIERRVRHAGADLPLQALAELFALHSTGFDEIRASSLHRAICLFFASLVDVEVSRQEIEVEKGRFLRSRSLNDAEALRAWLTDNDLSAEDFEAFIHEEALCSRLRKWVLGISQFDRGAKQLFDEMRRRGIYESWKRCAAEESLIVNNYYERPEYASVRSQDPAALAQEHSCKTGVRITGDAGEWAEEHGFDSVDGLAAALRRASVANDVKDRIATIEHTNALLAHLNLNTHDERSEE